MKRAFLFIWLCAGVTSLHAQYAPQAGLPGSTAISAASSQFVSWATQCTIQRGYMDINNPSLGYTSAGDSSLALGAPDHNIVSLGDNGVATLTFPHPIIDGPGPDFAVFENGFLNTANDSEAFLELAFVEVSSDGVNYFRFPATSLTQHNVQIGNGNYINACNLNNLAGKYIGMYGTPFDLSELAGTPGLDVNNVTHVRLVDVVGSIGAHASLDHLGNIINDPYPTAFFSCGFDLDAVGVINQSGTGVKELTDDVPVNVFPNPVADRISVTIKTPLSNTLTATLTGMAGNMLKRYDLAQAVNSFDIASYPAGLYYLVITDTNGGKWVEKVVKR